MVVKKKSAVALTVLQFPESSSVPTLTYLIKQICHYYTIILTKATYSLKKAFTFKSVCLIYVESFD